MFVITILFYFVYIVSTWFKYCSNVSISITSSINEYQWLLLLIFFSCSPNIVSRVSWCMTLLQKHRRKDYWFEVMDARTVWVPTILSVVMDDLRRCYGRITAGFTTIVCPVNSYWTTGVVVMVIREQKVGHGIIIIGYFL